MKTKLTFLSILAITFFCSLLPVSLLPASAENALAVDKAAMKDVSSQKVTEQMVQQAVRGWCDGLLKISKTAMDGGDASAVASEILTTAYNYANGGKVLFKPTLTFGDQTFRLNKEGALAYFIGGNPNYPNDSGFALKKWVKADFDVAGIITEGNIGIYMGNVTLTDAESNQVTVDKTFVFKFVQSGSPLVSPAVTKPVIIAHKSALPFKP